MKVWNRKDKNTPKDAVYVGRGTKWGNPYTHRQDVANKRDDVILVNSRADAVESFAIHLYRTPELRADLHELAGKDLVCWCAPQICHADVLMAFANTENITWDCLETVIDNILRREQEEEAMSKKDKQFIEAAAELGEEARKFAEAKVNGRLDPESNNYGHDPHCPLSPCICGADEIDPERSFEEERDHEYERTIVEPIMFIRRVNGKIFVSVTGHRPDKIGGYNFNNPIRKFLRAEFKEFLLELQRQNPDDEIIVNVGGAIGVDQDYAKVAYDNGFKFHLFVPFEGQELYWPKDAQESYWRMRNAASWVTVVSDRGHNEDGSLRPIGKKWMVSAMNRRNAVMVDAGDILVAAWNGSSGGTGNAVSYAEAHNKMVYRIDPRDYRS